MSRAIKFTLLSASILFSLACNFATNLLNQASGSNAVNIPLMPQAKDIVSYQGWVTIYHYDTTASPEDVQTFYTDHYKALGWEITNSYPGLVSASKLGTAVKNPTNLVGISGVDIETTPDQSADITDVQIHSIWFYHNLLDKIFDMVRNGNHDGNDVPFMPQATDTTTLQDQMTIYRFDTTSASPADVQTFYTDHYKTPGWLVVSSDSTHVEFEEDDDAEIANIEFGSDSKNKSITQVEVSYYVKTQSK